MFEMQSVSKLVESLSTFMFSVKLNVLQIQEVDIIYIQDQEWVYFEELQKARRPDSNRPLIPIFSRCAIC